MSAFLKKNGIYMAVMGLFLGIGIVVGLHHEPWTDEAQSWLIARDCSFAEILSAIQYEGSPPLWHFVLHCAALCRLPYSYLFVVPLAITAVGVFTLLFFTNASPLLKCLLPFTFFIQYQSSLVARSYCMVFPLLMILVALYEKRHQKPAAFYLTLILLAGTSSYGIVITGSFLLLELCYFVEELKNKRLKTHLFQLACFVFTGICCLLFGLIVLPPADCSFSLGTPKYYYIFDVITATFFMPVSSVALNLLVGTGCIVWFCYLCKDDLFKSLILVLPVMCYLEIYNRFWHLQNLYVLAIATVLIFHKKEEGRKRRYSETIPLSVFLAVQMICTVVAATLDITNDYDPGKSISEFLKSKPYLETATIRETSFHDISLLPYFEDNVFCNMQTDSSYYQFSTNNHYDDFLNSFTRNKKNSSLPVGENIKFLDHVTSDIVIAKCEFFDEICESPYGRQLLTDYNRYLFNANLIFKCSFDESRTTYVFIKKELDT